MTHFPKYGLPLDGTPILFEAYSAFTHVSFPAQRQAIEAGTGSAKVERRRSGNSVATPHVV